MNAQPDVIIGLDVGTTAVKVAAFARTPANASSAPRCANIDSSDQNRVGKCRTRRPS
jgi:sugar (pentulose or hexulose) kinase